jgi:REP element-mobilizing transposase RayT
MANTYSQVYIHIVFVVKGRLNLISENHREELQKFITGIISKRDQKLLAIYCNPNHTHIFVGMKPQLSISDLVRDIKAGSSKFINDKKWIAGKFSWQEGFGSFSHSHSHIDTVVKYVNNQKEHHHKKTFKEEYLEILKNFAVDYDDRYLFEWVE